MMTSKMDELLGIKSPYIPYKPVYTYKPLTNTHNSYYGAYNASFKQTNEYTLVRTIWTNGVPAEAPTHYDLARIGIIEIRKLARIRMIFLQQRLDAENAEMAMYAEYRMFEHEYYALYEQCVNTNNSILKCALKCAIEKLLKTAEKRGFEVY